MSSKKIIKVNFRYFWEGFDPENNFFTNLLRKKYDVVIDEKPDYLFYSVFPERKYECNLSRKGDVIRGVSPFLYIILRKIYSKFKNISKKKISPPSGDFVKILFASEHVRPNMGECDWAFSSYDEEEINHPRYLKIPMYKIIDYKIDDGDDKLIKRKLNFQKIKSEKPRFCNFIYSQENRRRNNFFKKLNKYKKVDAPGRCMNNMPPINFGNPKDSRASKNWANEKLDFLKNYKFTIAFENFSSKGWVTEKLTHPMKMNSIPIYFGHESVKNEFNTKSFINYHDFKNMKEFIKYIIRVDNDDKLYRRILNEPWLTDNKKTKYIDDNRIIKRFEEIFEGKKK